MVKEAGPKPSKAEITKLAKYADLQVRSRSYEDWYCLLRNCQGSLKNVLDSGYVLDDEDESPDYTLDFTKGTFFCDWDVDDKWELPLEEKRLKKAVKYLSKGHESYYDDVSLFATRKE